MLLSGDVGGTKTLLGFSRGAASGPRRSSARISTADYDSLGVMIGEALEAAEDEGI